MRPPPTRAAAFAVLALAAAPLALAAQAPAARPDSAARRPGASAELPLKPARTISYDTDEGTWLSLDLSPDGRTIVFDMMGDVYTLPVAGGTATRLTSGMAMDAHPRFSPDGRSIVYVSDRDGSDDLWLMDADGKNQRQLSRTDRTAFLSPAWTPDGRYVVVSRNAQLTGTQYNLWLYHRDGGTGVRMTGPAAPTAGASPAGGGPVGAARNYVGPAVTKDGRYVYAASRMGGAAGYNQTGFDWTIVAYDRESGETTPRAIALGGAFKPVLSPDGRWLVYGTRQDSVTSLRLRDLQSGDERWLVRDVQRDDMESRFTRDLLPNMAFTPDSRALLAAWGGKIRRVELADGRSTVIPFTARIEQGMGALSKFEYRVNDSTLTVGQIRGARPSPDGTKLAFTALDKLWIMDLPGGTPRRLTRSPHAMGEHSPVWSPDGRFIAFVTWTDSGGDIMRIPVGGRGTPAAERLTRQRAFYSDVNYTPDGRRLVAYRSPRQARVEEMPAIGRELVWLPGTGGELQSVTLVGGNTGYPHFTRAHPDRIWMYAGSDGLVSMRFDGTDRRAHLKVTGNPDYRLPAATPSPAGEILVSPDGERALAEVDNNVFVVTLPAVGATATTVSILNPATAPVPVRRLTRIGGDFIGWMADGNRVHYSIGRSYFTYDLARADSLVRDSTQRADARRTAAPAAAAADSVRADTARTPARPAYEPVRLDVTITVPKDRPQGSVVLRNARIVTMKGDEVIERGDVLVTNNRIAAVGAAGTLTIPAGTREIDATGKTILPGYVDTHAHLRPPFGVHKAQVWEYLANLAYGVTTTRDPQTGTTDVLSYGDLVETGDILGPRIYSTGPGVFWSDDIKSLADARDVLRRYSEFYDTKTIKQYMVGDRKVRQWVVMAAKELGLTPTLEGGLDYRKNLTEAQDGYAGIEHSFPIAPLYKDNLQMLAESGTTYTPTLLVIYGGPWVENWWYQQYDILADEKLRRFTPLVELQQRGLRRPGWWHPSQYSHPLIAAQARKLVEAGGRVGVGSHGQLQGLGFHWEMWTIATGGMKNHDVLRAATTWGADALGLARDLGSVQGGMLADLVVLDQNPLQDIRHTNTVRWVMKNGRLYDGTTLEELWPRKRDIGSPWWLAQNASVVAKPGDHDDF